MAVNMVLENTGKLTGMSTLRFHSVILLRTMAINPPLSHAEFEGLCRNNDNIRLEHTKEGLVRMNPPAGGYTGDANAEIQPTEQGSAGDRSRRRAGSRVPPKQIVGNGPR
jgi:hypothetical protein